MTGRAGFRRAETRLVPGPDNAHLALRSLARHQAGVVSREQTLGHGVSDRTIARLTRTGHWRRLTPGVFLLADVEPTFEARVWAGVLLGGEDAAASGLTSARLGGLTDVEPGAVTVLVPHGRRILDRPGWEFVQSTRPFRTVGSPPRTTVEDTVLDLCAVGPPGDVVGWVTVAVQRKKTTAARLRRALAARGRHPRRALLEGLLGDVAVGAQSPLEITYLRDVERAHGLAALVSRQLPSRRRQAVRDVVYAEYGVVVELDGRLGHDELGRFRDMNRDNVATLDGLLTLRFGSVDLYGRPCEVAAQVAAALQQRGWTGVPTRCPRCALVPEREWVVA